MSEHATSVRYKVSVEGADESIREFQGVLTDVSRGIRLVSQLDYLTMSWQRAMEKADLGSFLSLALSTISTMQTLIRLIKSAELAQIAYNAALAIGRLLEGPSGWAILAAAGVTIGAGATYVATRPGSVSAEETLPREERFRRASLEQIEKEARQREKYRSVVNH